MQLKCSYCEEITTCDCPEDHNRHPEAKFMCEVCQTLCEMGEKEDALKNSPKRQEVKTLMEVDKKADEFAQNIAEKTFEEIWKENKDAFKELSKKDLAETFYFRGLHFSASTFLGATLEEVQQLENAIEEYKAGKISAGKAAEMAGG